MILFPKTRKEQQFFANPTCYLLSTENLYFCALNNLLINQLFESA